MRFRDTLPGWAKALILLQPLIMVALGLAVVLGGCIKHQEPNRQAEKPKIVAADPVSYGLPSEETHVRHCLAIYDSLLALVELRTKADRSVYIPGEGVYYRAGLALQEAIDGLWSADCRAPSDFIGIADFTMSEWVPRYHRYQTFVTSGQPQGWGGRDLNRLRELSEKYEPILERGYGQARRK